MNHQDLNEMLQDIVLTAKLRVGNAKTDNVYRTLIAKKCATSFWSRCLAMV